MILVGAGIVNLMTAWRLAAAGYRIDVYDSGPGPTAIENTEIHSCTLGGGNARMYTLTEADVYHRLRVGKIAAGGSVLGATVASGGWRAFRGEARNSEEQQWAEQFGDIPADISGRYELEIIRVNREAGHAWDSCIRNQECLFRDSGLARGILRIYACPDSLRQGIERNQRIGALRRTLSTEQVAADHPALAGACRTGDITGGIEVPGFTVGIHDFVAGLVALLERHGVNFYWLNEIDVIEWSETGGKVAGLRAADGALVKATHYVLSPGVYGKRLLSGTAAAVQIQGVAGAWLTIPNIDGRQAMSIKVRQDNHVTPDTNVTVLNDESKGPVLILGAGYGWVGEKPDNIDEAQLDVIFRGIEDTARRLFPQAYHAAAAEGWLRSTRRSCIRPWTASSLGIFEIHPTSSGGRLIVTGGNNTGGFAQAPVIGEAVLAALEERPHPVHEYYSTHRLRRDLTTRLGVDEIRRRTA